MAELQVPLRSRSMYNLWLPDNLGRVPGPGPRPPKVAAGPGTPCNPRGSPPSSPHCCVGRGMASSSWPRDAPSAAPATQECSDGGQPPRFEPLPPSGGRWGRPRRPHCGFGAPRSLTQPPAAGKWLAKSGQQLPSPERARELWLGQKLQICVRSTAHLQRRRWNSAPKVPMDPRELKTSSKRLQTCLHCSRSRASSVS